MHMEIHTCNSAPTLCCHLVVDSRQNTESVCALPSSFLDFSCSRWDYAHIQLQSRVPPVKLVSVDRVNFNMFVRMLVGLLADCLVGLRHLGNVKAISVFCC